jgi:hypothetical protein
MFSALEPQEPHYYLSLLGTYPACAGHGLAQRPLTHNLAIIDREDAAAVLACADSLVPPSAATTQRWRDSAGRL